MNTTITNAIAQLNIDEIDNIDEYILILKARKKQLRLEKISISNSAKEAAKEAEKAAKLEAKEAEKAAKLEAKEAEKAAKLEAKEAEKVAKLEAKEAEKAAKLEAKEAEKTEKDAIKAAEKAEKDAIKAAEKAEKDAIKVAQKQAKETAKILTKLQKSTLKHAKKATGEPVKPKNWAYQNFTRYSNGEDGPTDTEISEAGGKREWLKTQWTELTKDQQTADDAPWNVHA
jgi:hypothetical protein